MAISDIGRVDEISYRFSTGGWRAGTRVVDRVVGQMGGFGLYYWPGGPVAGLFFFFDFMAANQD